MQGYRAFSPGVQVLGRMMLAAIECVNSDHIEPYMRQNGLLGRQDDLQPILADRWYSQQDWLNVLNALIAESQSTAMFDLVSVGMATAKILTSQAGFADLSLEEKLKSWSHVYQEQHRGGSCGEINVYRAGENHIVADMRTPYPDDIHYGVIYAIASQYSPKMEFITVRYDDQMPRRDSGGEVTRYHVMWKR